MSVITHTGISTHFKLKLKLKLMFINRSIPINERETLLLFDVLLSTLCTDEECASLGFMGISTREKWEKLLYCF